MLAQATVLPLYGQIAVQDVGTSDLPDWETGEERAVATEHAVLVATQSDADGDVTVTVVEGSADVPGDLVFDGELSLTSPRLEVGSALAATLTVVVLGRLGYVRIKICVEPADSPSRITVLVEPAA